MTVLTVQSGEKDTIISDIKIQLLESKDKITGLEETSSKKSECFHLGGVGLKQNKTGMYYKLLSGLSYTCKNLTFSDIMYTFYLHTTVKPILLGLSCFSWTSIIKMMQFLCAEASGHLFESVSDH